MFTAGATSEVAVHDQDGCALVLRAIKGVPAVLLAAVIGEYLGAEAIKGHAFEKARRDDPVGVDVIAAQHHGGSAHAGDGAAGERS